MSDHDNKYRFGDDSEWEDWLNNNSDPSEITSRYKVHDERVRPTNSKKRKHPRNKLTTRRSATTNKSSTKYNGFISILDTKFLQIFLKTIKRGLRKTSRSINKFFIKLQKISKTTTNQKKYSVGTLLVLLLVGLVYFNTVRLSRNLKIEEAGVLHQTTKNPDFELVLPKSQDKDKDDIKSGIKFDPTRRVASFTDKIGLVSITVSQQPLPESFKTSPDEQLENLAKNFSANELIISTSPKTYLGTSAKGPQTAIFYRREVLIFIQSASKIENVDWIDYIRNFN